MELPSLFKRVARIIPLLLILCASAQLAFLSLDQLGTPGRVFDAELSIGKEAWKFKSKLESGCFCCSGAALIPQRTESLEAFAASKPDDALKPRDLAHHLLSTLQETQSSLSHSSSLPRHLTVNSQTYPLNPRNINLPDYPPSRRQVWCQGKGCAVVSYSEDRNASATHGENVWGMITSDRGWDDEVQEEGKGREAILVVALLDGEGRGGGLKSWGMGAGLMEWYARGGGPNSSPLARPLVFLFAQDTRGVKAFLETYRSKDVRDPRSSDPYSYLGGPLGRPRIMATLNIHIPTLNTTSEGLEHYGPLTLRTAPSADLTDQNSHLLSLASFVTSIRSPVTPFLVDNGTSTASSSPFADFVKSWSPVASQRFDEFSSLLRSMFLPSGSLTFILDRHQIPSLTLHLPRQLTTSDSPFSHSVYSISTLSQVLDSTIQALSKIDLPDHEGRVEVGWEMWIAGEGLGLGAALLGTMMVKKKRSLKSLERRMVALAGGVGVTGGWNAMGRASLTTLSPLVYAVAIITLTSGLILRPHLPSFDPLLPWLNFLLALALPLVVYLPPIRRILVVISLIPFLTLSSSVSAM